MSTVSGTRRAPRRQSQDGSADKVVVILEASTPVAGSRRVPPTPVPGARNAPIDVETIEDEVQAVSPSRVPPPRRNRRTRREPITVVDLEVESSREGNKRQRAHCINIDIDWGAGSSLQSNAIQTGKAPTKEVPKEPSGKEPTKEVPGSSGKEPTKEVPKEPFFTCPICWNKMEEPSTTTCGHLFCHTCIKQAIKVQKKCPTCRKKLKLNSAHRIYLPQASS